VATVPRFTITAHKRSSAGSRHQVGQLSGTVAVRGMITTVLLIK
jgi:hypothetical protein